jgi:uncharacterized SAM-binding protein YcdF (DUF218 family)
MKKVLITLLVIGGSIYLFALIYVGIHTRDNTAKPSDAIVVLGARTLYKNKTNPCLQARVAKAVTLYKKKFAPIIIMTGGNDGYEKNNQAQLMHSLAVASGVPSDAILLETKSSNTYENFLYTKKIVEKNDFHSIIIVSDPYHLARAALLAKTMGIPATVSPATESPCWSTYQFLGFDYFRDSLALLQYIATGKISFSSLTRE